MNDGTYNVVRDKALEELVKFREVLDEEKIELTIEPGWDVHISPDLLSQLRMGM